MRVVRVRLAVTMPAMVMLWPSANRTGPSSAEKSSRMVVDGHRSRLPGQRPVIRHGMAAEIKARSLLLHEHPLGGGELRNVRQVASPPVRRQSSPAAIPNRVQLALHDSCAGTLQCCPAPFQRPGSAGSVRHLHGVKGAAADQISPLPACSCPCQSNIRWQKSWNDREGAVLLPPPQSCVWIKPRPMFLMATSPKRMLSILHGEAVAGAVHVRGQQLNAAVPALERCTPPPCPELSSTRTSAAPPCTPV